MPHVQPNRHPLREDESLVTYDHTFFLSSSLAKFGVVKSGRVESVYGSSRGRVGVVLGSTPCQVGWGRVGVWVELGTSRGRVGVDSVSSRPGSSRGLGGVGDGSGSYWGRFWLSRAESDRGLGRVGDGSGSYWESKPFQIEAPIGIERRRFQHAKFFPGGIHTCCFKQQHENFQIFEFLRMHIHRTSLDFQRP